MYLFERQIDKEVEAEVVHTGSLSKRWQQPGLGQDSARPNLGAWKSTQVSDDVAGCEQ